MSGPVDRLIAQWKEEAAAHEESQLRCNGDTRKFYYHEGCRLTLHIHAKQLADALAQDAPAPEVCICAAVLTEEGLVIRGHRHHDALKAASLAFCTPKRGEDAQGFITSRNRYVTREEGYQLQVAAGHVSVNGYRGERLFSEDLY